MRPTSSGSAYFLLCAAAILGCLILPTVITRLL